MAEDRDKLDADDLDRLDYVLRGAANVMKRRGLPKPLREKFGQELERRVMARQEADPTYLIRLADDLKAKVPAKDSEAKRLLCEDMKSAADAAGFARSTKADSVSGLSEGFDIIDPEAGQAVWEAAKREAVADLREAIKQLPWRKQLIIHLTFHEEFSIRDAAGLIGLSKTRTDELQKEAFQDLALIIARLRRERGSR
jgi:hypothetical protein